MTVGIPTVWARRNINADWLLLTIPSGGIADVTPNDIHVLVAQGNDADTSALELGPQ